MLAACWIFASLAVSQLMGFGFCGLVGFVGITGVGVGDGDRSSVLVFRPIS
jgi:hypothetical protein